MRLIRILGLLVIVMLALSGLGSHAQQRLFIPTCSGNAAADTAAVTALKTIIGATNPGTIQFPAKSSSASFCKLNSITFTPNITIDLTNGGLQAASGATIALSQPPIAPLSQVFYGTGTVTIAKGSVRPDWWATNTTQGTTDMTAAITAAAAALPDTAAAGSGTLRLSNATYLITSWTVSKQALIIEGEGIDATIIKGSGAGSCTLCLNGKSRLTLSNLTIDGGEIKTAAMTILGSSGVAHFNHVRWTGGTVNTLAIGTAGGSADDIADVLWADCIIQSNNASGGQVKYRGNNVASNVMLGGRVSTGNSPAGATAFDIDDGATVRLYGTELLGRSENNSYVVVKASGVFQMFGGHVEAAGILHTLSSDTRRDYTTPPDIIQGVTSATSGTNAIYHEAPRTLILEGTRFGGNVRIGTDAIVTAKANGFSPGNSYVKEGNATLNGADAVKSGSVLAENQRLADTLVYSIPSASNKTAGLWLFDEDSATVTVTDRGTLSHDLTLAVAAYHAFPVNRGLASSLQFSQETSKTAIGIATASYVGTNGTTRKTFVNDDTYPNSRHSAIANEHVLIYSSDGATQRTGTVGSGELTVASVTSTTVVTTTDLPSDYVTGDMMVPVGPYFSTPDHADFSFGDGATDSGFTFIAALTPSSMVSNPLWGKYNSATGSGEYLFNIDGSGKLCVLISDQSASASLQRCYNTPLTDNGTMHVYAATYNGNSLVTGLKLYRDGVRVDDTSISSGAYVAMENTADVPGDFTFAPGRIAGAGRWFGLQIIREEWTAAQVLRATRLFQAHAAKS